MKTWISRHPRLASLWTLWLLLALGHVLSPPPTPDLGAWRLVVLQSDDWGLEGWFPDAPAAAALGDLVRSLPGRLDLYAGSTLENGEDVRRLARVLEQIIDADGLPPIFQANTVVAGCSVDRELDEADALGWPIHESGAGEGRYRRPGLRQAIDEAIDRGLWRPELHGLTHFDLEAYARARRHGEPISLRAAEQGTLAFDGWMRMTELGHGNPERARLVASEAHERFVRRFGRAPVSMVAPDYRWGSADERAWAELGIEVVQAKREQIDPQIDPRDLAGRIRKWIARWWDQHRKPFVYLERWARLEPYGDPDAQCLQGAREAAMAVRAAWAKGEIATVSIHRIQLVHLDPAVPAAGLRHLLLLIEELGEERPLRFVVDAEVAQLQRRGWSTLDRGPWRVVRNYTGQTIRVSPGVGESPRSFGVGTHVLGRPAQQEAARPGEARSLGSL